MYFNILFNMNRLCLELIIIFMCSKNCLILKNFDKKIKISVDLKLILSQYKYFKKIQIPNIYYPITLMYNIEPFFFKNVANVLR